MTVDWELLVLKAGLDERRKQTASGNYPLAPTRHIDEWDPWAQEAGRGQARAVLHALLQAGWRAPVTP